MIAHQETDIMPAFLLQLDGSLHNIRTIGPAINQIAQKNDMRTGLPARGIVFVDFLKQLLHQFMAAVNIADGINAHAIGNAGDIDRLFLALFFRSEKS